MLPIMCPIHLAFVLRKVLCTGRWVTRLFSLRFCENKKIKIFNILALTKEVNFDFPLIILCHLKVH